MGVLYKWLCDHPNVKIDLVVKEKETMGGRGVYTRDEMNMYYNGQIASRCINDRYHSGDGWFRYKLNGMYRQCGGKFFIDELNLSVREYNVLCRNDVVEKFDYIGLTVSKFLDVDGFGPKMVSDILIELCKNGFLLHKKDCRPIRLVSCQKNFEEYKDYELFIPEYKYEGDYVINI